MHFLRVNITFYDAVNMIHDVIRTANQFPYTARFMFVGVRNKNREYVYSVAVYQKYLTRLGELRIFEPLRENYHFSQRS